MKNSEPMKKIWTTTMDRNGCRYQAEMIGTDAGVVSPRCEGAEVGSEQQSGEGEDGGDEGPGPASAQVGELRDGLGEEDLVGVALEIAQDGGAEDGGDDDHAKKAC